MGSEKSHGQEDRKDLTLLISLITCKYLHWSNRNYVSFQTYMEQPKTPTTNINKFVVIPIRFSKKIELKSKITDQNAFKLEINRK